MLDDCTAKGRSLIRQQTSATSGRRRCWASSRWRWSPSVSVATTSQYHGTGADRCNSHPLLQIRQAAQGHVAVRAGLVAGWGMQSWGPCMVPRANGGSGQYSSRSTTAASVPTTCAARSVVVIVALHHRHAVRPLPRDTAGIFVRRGARQGQSDRSVPDRRAGRIRGPREAVTAAPAIVDNVADVSPSCVVLFRARHRPI